MYSYFFKSSHNNSYVSQFQVIYKMSFDSSPTTQWTLHYKLKTSSQTYSRLPNQLQEMRRLSKQFLDWELLLRCLTCGCTHLIMLEQGYGFCTLDSWNLFDREFQLGVIYFTKLVKNQLFHFVMWYMTCNSFVTMLMTKSFCHKINDLLWFLSNDSWLIHFVT